MMLLVIHLSVFSAMMIKVTKHGSSLSLSCDGLMVIGHIMLFIFPVCFMTFWWILFSALFGTFEIWAKADLLRVLSGLSYQV